MNFLFADLIKSATTSQKSKLLRQLSYIIQLLLAYNVSSRSQLEEPNRECNTLVSVNPVAESVAIPTSSLLISCLLCPVLADTAGFCRKPKKEVEEEEKKKKGEKKTQGWIVFGLLLLLLFFIFFGWGVGFGLVLLLVSKANKSFGFQNFCVFFFFPLP
jgi:hypothetical protein